MKKLTLPIITILLAAIFLTGCTGTGIDTSWPGITVTEDTVYTAYTQGVYAVSAANGSPLWHYPEKAGKMTFFAAPALGPDGQLIVGDYSNALHVIDTKNGTGRSIFTAEGKWIAQPTVDGDVIFAANSDHYLYAIDLNGNLKWKFETGSLLWSNPLVIDGIVFLGAMDHYLYALDAKTGQQVWKADAGGAIIGNLVDANGSIFLGTMANEAVSVNKANGKINWRFTAGNAVWSGPAIKDGYLYFGDLDGNFYALTEADRKVLWQYKADGAIVGTPLLTDAGIYFTVENGNLVQLDYTGKLVYSKPLSANLYGTPVVSGEQILVGTTDKEKILIVLDSNGNQVWVLPQPK